MDEIRNRLQHGLDIRGMKPIDLCNKTKISKSAISQYLSGYAKPKADRIFIIAKALDVNEAWLMGLDVPMERSDKKLNNIDEKTIIEKYNKLNKKQKENLLDYAEFLLQQQKDK